MSSEKEREILKRQRLLAARFNVGGGSGTADAAGRPAPNNNKKPKPPAAPHRNKKKKPGVIDLTTFPYSSTSAASTTKSLMKAPPKRKPPPPSGAPPPPPTGASAQQKRPTQQHKRPSARTTNASSSSTSRAATATTIRVPRVAAAKKAEALPSPKLQRKNKPPPTTTNKNGTTLLSKSTSSTLSKLVQHVVATSNNTINNDDEMFMAQSLKVHQPDDFWKSLREWDLPSQYYKEMKLQRTQPAPASLSDNDKKDSESTDEEEENTDTGRRASRRTTASSTKPLPNTFLNPRHYVAAWAPLCLAECRSQLLQEMAQNTTEPILVSVQHSNNGGGRRNRHNNNRDFYGGTTDAPWMEENETGCHVMITPKQRDTGNLTFMANDLVLLLQPQYQDLLRDIAKGTAIPPGGIDPDDDPDLDAFAGISMIGHTESSRRELNGLIVKVSKRKFVKMNSTKEMWLVKVGSNVTALREFTALCSVDTLPMKQYLLAQHLEKVENRRKLSRNQPIQQLLDQMGGAKLGDGFLSYARNKFNQSQLTAIAASAHEYGEGGFTLIKGPPGTGKTTTMVAVLNSLHIRQYNKFYDEVRRIAAKPTGSRESQLALARRSKPRLLVCAPSNAAVDNIILKIMEDGFIDGQGNRYNPSMIRVGVGQSTQVRDVSLDSNVDSIYSEYGDAQQIQSSIAGYRSELSRITGEIAKLRRRATAIERASPWPVSSDWEIRVDEEKFEQIQKAYFVNHKQHVTTYEVPPPPKPDETQFKTTSMPEYRAYLGRIVKLVDRYFSVKEHLERCTIVKGSLENGANQFEVRMNLESHVLNAVHMVMTTLGSAGKRALEAADRFEVIVVDEAAQSVEPASLAALRLGSRHAVLVGDPQQLPATIFNMSGRNSKYDRSLFQRLEEAGQPVYMLNEQYRMHPQISHFPRNIFYGGALLDGPNVTKADYGNPLRAIVCRAVPNFSSFTILDLDSKEERGGTSLSNLSEAKLAVYLYQQLKEVSRGLSCSSKVAVITPYAQQCRLLRQSFAELLGQRYEKSVEVNTVDAFQGREASIVIFSAVRAAGSKGIGFLSDVRRMNVALTRAKHFLFVIARCDSIIVNPYWFDLVKHARETNAVVRVPMIGRGSTATFPLLTSWKQERVNADEKMPVRLAKDPRKSEKSEEDHTVERPRDPRKQKRNTPEKGTERPEDPRKRSKR